MGKHVLILMTETYYIYNNKTKKIKSTYIKILIQTDDKNINKNIKMTLLYKNIRKILLVTWSNNIFYK